MKLWKRKATFRFKGTADVIPSDPSSKDEVACTIHEDNNSKRVFFLANFYVGK